MEADFRARDLACLHCDEALWLEVSSELRGRKHLIDERSSSTVSVDHYSSKPKHFSKVTHDTGVRCRNKVQCGDCSVIRYLKTM